MVCYDDMFLMGMVLYVMRSLGWELLVVSSAVSAMVCRAALGPGGALDARIGFSIQTPVDINVNTVLNILLSYALKINPDFCILPLGGGNQSSDYHNGIQQRKKELTSIFSIRW
jgi:hypothetical protein